MFKNDKFVSQKRQISYNHRHNLVGQGGANAPSKYFLRGANKKLGLVGESGVCISNQSSLSLYM